MPPDNENYRAEFWVDLGEQTLSAGATITVELRLTNPDDATDYYVINSTAYTFQ